MVRGEIYWHHCGTEVFNRNQPERIIGRHRKVAGALALPKISTRQFHAAHSRGHRLTPKNEKEGGVTLPVVGLRRNAVKKDPAGQEISGSNTTVILPQIAAPAPVKYVAKGMYVCER